MRKLNSLDDLTQLKIGNDSAFKEQITRRGKILSLNQYTSLFCSLDALTAKIKKLRDNRVESKLVDSTNEFNITEVSSIQIKEESQELSIYSSQIDNIKSQIASSKKDKPQGLTSIHINRKSAKMLVNSMDSVQYVFDMNNLEKEPPLKLTGHQSSYYIKSIMSPNGQFILSGSKNADLFIWSCQADSIPQVYQIFHESEVAI